MERARARARLGLRESHVFVHPGDKASRRYRASLGYVARAELAMIQRALR